MAQIETVHPASTSADSTEEILKDESINPDLTEHMGQIQITLVFTQDVSAGVDMDTAIWDMVNDKFGTVASNKVPARGTYEFIIS